MRRPARYTPADTPIADTCSRLRFVLQTSPAAREAPRARHTESRWRKLLYILQRGRGECASGPPKCGPARAAGPGCSVRRTRTVTLTEEHTRETKPTRRQKSMRATGWQVHDRSAEACGGSSDASTVAGWDTVREGVARAVGSVREYKGAQRRHGIARRRRLMRQRPEREGGGGG